MYHCNVVLDVAILQTLLAPATPKLNVLCVHG